RLERQGPLAVLTLDRPPANALNRDFFSEVGTVLPALAAVDVRGVVVTGTGRFFSAGLDLFEILTYRGAEASEFMARFDDGFTGLFALEKPVVAAVNGHAIAGGAVLAATADFRLAAEGDGRIGLTEIQVGVPFPTSALEVVRFSCAGPYLPELLFHGRTYAPEEARVRRLVDDVVPAAELLPRALALAGELAARPLASFAASKRAPRADGLARIPAARGAGEESSVVLRRGLSGLGAGGSATVLGAAERLSVPHAALANGAAAHALEMDDTHQGGSIHLGATVFSAALAAAELAAAGGRTVLHAAVAGYEVAARLAMALGPASHYRRGFHPTGTCGAFGAA